PYAGKPPVRSGGRGRRKPIPTLSGATDKGPEPVSSKAAWIPGSRKRAPRNAPQCNAVPAHGRRGGLSRPAPREWRSPRLFLHEPLQVHGVGVAGIDVAVVVRADTFERAEGLGLFDERLDLAVLGAADPDALLEAGVHLVGRLGIRDIDDVVLV